VFQSIGGKEVLEDASVIRSHPNGQCGDQSWAL